MRPGNAAGGSCLADVSEDRWGNDRGRGMLRSRPGAEHASLSAVLEAPWTFAYPVGHSWHVLPAAMQPADGADSWRADDGRGNGFRDAR
jgi:hypothetical protein